MLHRTLGALLSILLLPPMAYASPRPTLTNAARMRAGLGPLKPRTLFNPTRVGEARQVPSGSPPAGLQCCNTVVSASNVVAGQLLSLLGVNVSPSVPVGLNCSPVTVLGIGATCAENLVVCDNNSFNGIVAVNCVPFTA
ncbi:fungal hydrophobin [Mycena polygramma]|nr:fungal hydrophobin [Mycena polygramma]